MDRTHVAVPHFELQPRRSMLSLNEFGMSYPHIIYPAIYRYFHENLFSNIIKVLVFFFCFLVSRIRRWVFFGSVVTSEYFQGFEISENITDSSNIYGSGYAMECAAFVPNVKGIPCDVRE